MPVRAKYKEEQNTKKSKILGRAKYKEEQITGKSKIPGRAKYKEGQNTGKSKIQDRAKYKEEQNTGQSKIQRRAYVMRVWRMGGGQLLLRPIIPFHPNHDAHNWGQIFLFSLFCLV